LDFEPRDDLELVGSQASSRAMRIELARLASACPDLVRARPAALAEHRIAIPFDAGWASVLRDYARTPSRIFWNWARVRAHRLDALWAGLHRAAAEPPVEGDWTFAVEVRAKGAVQASPLQIRGLVRRFVESAWGWTLRPREPDIPIAVRAAPDGVWVSADLGGDLTRRGYRPARQTAPVRENLAAQMVALAGWYPDREPLVDPFAGSGTLLAEADGWAWGRPARPSTNGRHDGAWWGATDGGTPSRGDLFRSKLADAPPRLLGLEADARQRPALAAALGERPVRFELDDFRHVTPAMLRERLGPNPGLVLTNPPYGVRVELEPEELEALHADLAAWFRALGPGWRLALIGLAASIEPAFDRPPRMKKPMRNGDLRTHFYVFDHPEPARPPG